MQFSKGKFKALCSGSNNEQHKYRQEVNDSVVLLQKIVLRQGPVSQQHNATAKKGSHTIAYKQNHLQAREIMLPLYLTLVKPPQKYCAPLRALCC